jgi:hypothetical protein
MILGVTGLIGSGKDTIADYLVTEHGFKRVSFAASLKDAVSAVFGWDREMLEGTSKESRKWREEVDTWWAERLNMPNLTPRWVLQYMGTDVFRNHFHTDIWVASVENKLRQTNDDIIITDCRFSNEVDAIKRAGGVTCRVFRGDNPSWYQAAIDYNRGPDGNSSWALGLRKLEKHKVHASEYSSVGLKYDHYIENDGTIDDLHKKVIDIVRSEQTLMQMI